MEIKYTKSVDKLIEKLSALPGIGVKTAERLTLHILNYETDKVIELCSAISDAKSKTKFCKICGNITENETCSICKNPKRDTNTMCIVETFRDVVSVENTNDYRGLYHVLGGHIAPLEGIMPDNLNIDSLFDRLDTIDEIILATNPNSEGDITALYVTKILNKEYYDIKVTKISNGVPFGTCIEFADPLTLSQSLEKRSNFGID